MNEISQAIHDVASYRVQKVCRPGLWRVYLEGDNVMFENLAEGEPAVVVTTVASDTAD